MAMPSRAPTWLGPHGRCASPAITATSAAGTNRLPSTSRRADFVRPARGTGLAAALLAAALLAAPLADPPAGAGAARCTHASPSVLVDLGRNDRAALRVGAGGELLVNGSPCGGALVADLESIAVSGRGGDQRLAIDLRGGGFGDAAIDAALGNGDGDAVAVIGSGGADEIEIAPERVDLDAAGTSRISLAGVNRVTASTRGGGDLVDGSAHQRKLKLWGG